MMQIFLNLDEASRFLLISKNTLYGWVHARKIPYRKHGSLLVFSKPDLETWSKSKEIRPLKDARLQSISNYDTSPSAQGPNGQSSLKIEYGSNFEPLNAEEQNGNKIN